MSRFTKLTKARGKKRSATIRRLNRHIYVDPAIEQVRSAFVTLAIKEMRQAGGKGRLVRVPVRMFEEHARHGISTLAGLEPVVSVACQRAGDKIRPIGGDRHSDLPAPAPLPASQRWTDPTILNLIQHHDAGVIHYDSQVWKTESSVLPIVQSL